MKENNLISPRILKTNSKNSFLSNSKSYSSIKINNSLLPNPELEKEREQDTFGQYFENEKTLEWEEHYIDYYHMKSRISDLVTNLQEIIDINKKISSSNSKQKEDQNQSRKNTIKSNINSNLTINKSPLPKHHHAKNSSAFNKEMDLYLLNSSRNNNDKSNNNNTVKKMVGYINKDGKQIIHKKAKSDAVKDIERTSTLSLYNPNEKYLLEKNLNLYREKDKKLFRAKIKNFISLLDEEVKKIHTFFTKKERKIFNLISKQIDKKNSGSENNNNLSSLINSCNDLLHISLLSKEIILYVFLNIKALKQILKIFDEKLSRIIKKMPFTYIRRFLRQNDSNLVYILSFRTIDETCIVIDDIFSFYKTKIIKNKS